MPAEGLTLSDFASYDDWRHYRVNLQNALDAVNMGRISPAEFESVVYQTTGRYVSPKAASNGRVIAYDFSDTPSFTETNPINSNASTTRRGKVRTAITSMFDTTGQVVQTGKITPPSAFPTRTAYIASSIASPLVAAGIGISLGKTIDSALYNLNPDFWDANGMGAINPETWNGITAGIDYTDPITGNAAALFNVIFGLDPEGNAQGYIDEDAFAYMAAYLDSKGAFGQGIATVTEDYEGLNVPAKWWPINYVAGNTIYAWWPYAGSFLTRTVSGAKRVAQWRANNTSNSYLDGAGVSDTPLGSGTGYGSYTHNGKTAYYQYLHVSNNVSPTDPRNNPPVSGQGVGANANIPGAIAWYIMFGPDPAAVPGIGTQTGATLPDFSAITDTSDIPAYKDALQTQYPDLWTNALNYPVIQPDGTVDNHTYIPFNMPIANDNTDTQPTSGDENQQRMGIIPGESPQSLINALVHFLQLPTDPYQPSTEDPAPANPPDTGGGSTPAAPIPTGSASALWSIYHPTQAQLDSFGAWLWSSNFVDQILKIFNDPMQSIIGLHKIYATPVDSGASTIAVGYLDSGVPSATVTQQYVTVDCGSVDLGEYFGNAFDYAPYTSVQLYLPFVGIVPLDVAQVMRSTISVVYEVDIFTGACLAKVDVSRDGGGGTLYQYSGDCAARYPLSSGSYMGIVSGIISIAGGIAATVATGGGAAPLALGAAGAALSAHTDVQHSGSFSGNAGAMGGKVPYLIINRPQTALADDVGHMAGYPANQTERIGACSGYIRATEIHDLAPSGATSDEVQQIIDAIREGVIV